MLLKNKLQEKIVIGKKILNLIKNDCVINKQPTPAKVFAISDAGIAAMPILIIIAVSQQLSGLQKQLIAFT